MTDAETVAEQRNAHIDGFNRQDVSAMSRTVTDDCIAMPPGQAPVAGRDALEAWWSEGFSAGKSTFTYVPHEVLVGEPWAYDRFDYTMETQLGATGETTTENGSCVWLWQKQADDSWKMARAIWNSVSADTGIWSGSPRI